MEQISFKIYQWTFKVFDLFTLKAIKITKQIQNNIGNEKTSYLYTILAMIFYFITSIYIKQQSEQKLNWALCMCLRGLCLAIGTYILSESDVLKQKTKDALERENPYSIICSTYECKMIILRSALVVFGQVVFYFLLDKISVSTLYICDGTGPIFVFILNFIYLQIPMHKKDVLALFLCFFGIVVVVAPEIVDNFFIYFNLQQQQQQQEANQTNTEKFQGIQKYFWVFMMIFSNFIWAISVLVMKSLKSNVICINYITGSTLQVIGTLALMMQASFNQTNEQLVQVSPLKLLEIFFVLGGLGFCFNILFVYSILITQDSGKQSLFTYFPVLFSFAYETLESGQFPNIYRLIGTGFAFYGIFYISLAKKK